MKNAKIFLIAISLVFCFSVPVILRAQTPVTSCDGMADNTPCSSKDAKTGALSTGVCLNQGCIVGAQTTTSTINSVDPNTGAVDTTDTTNAGINTGPNSANGTAGVNSGPGAASGSTASITFTNPLKYDTVEGVLTSLLNNLQGIIVTISIIFIIIGAILYITSAGDEKRISTAKKAITASMVGLAIGIAAPSFLKEISDILGWNNPTGIPAATLSLTQIALNVLNFLLSIVGILALIMLIVSGIMYVSSAGDEKRIDVAKKIMLYSIIGIIVTFTALVIVRQIANFFV